MVASDTGMGRLVEVLQQDTEARTRELAELNTQLEERNQLLQRQLGNKAAVAKWLALLGILLAVLVGAAVYQLMRQMTGDIGNMATKIEQMQIYMKNMGGGLLNDGEAGFMSSIARNTDSMARNTNSMTQDIGAMRKAMLQVSNDMGRMRLAMEQTRGDIGTMNQAMGSMGIDIKSVSDNISVMARSVGLMNRNVGRMSRDSQYLNNPMRSMDSVMPWW
jgi:hypothetical protein